MKYFEKQALLDEFSYATEDGSVLTYKDIEEILDHFDDGSVPVIELLPQENTDGLKRKYIVLKSDTGELVDDFPAADVRPVVRGRWIEFPAALAYKDAYCDTHIVCSACEAVFDIMDNDTERFNFCPNCGADMREES